MQTSPFRCTFAKQISSLRCAFGKRIGSFRQKAFETDSIMCYNGGGRELPPPFVLTVRKIGIFRAVREMQNAE